MPSAIPLIAFHKISDLQTLLQTLFIFSKHCNWVLQNQCQLPHSVCLSRRTSWSDQTTSHSHSGMACHAMDQSWTTHPWAWSSLTLTEVASYDGEPCETYHREIGVFKLFQHKWQAFCRRAKLVLCFFMANTSPSSSSKTDLTDVLLCHFTLLDCDYLPVTLFEVCVCV